MPQALLICIFLKKLYFYKTRFGRVVGCHWSCRFLIVNVKTLPEAQRTQDIESTTWIISESWNECKFQFSNLSPPPLSGNHLSHLVHLPVILLAHHHLNDSRYLPMFQQLILSPTWLQLTSTPAPIFRATPVPPPCRPPWWSPSPHWARPPSKWQPSTPNCPIGIIS